MAGNFSTIHSIFSCSTSLNHLSELSASHVAYDNQPLEGHTQRQADVAELAVVLYAVLMLSQDLNILFPFFSGYSELA